MKGTTMNGKTNKMKVESCEKLAELIARKLPWTKQSGKIFHLRNIKSDPTSHGKSLIIWYGCHKSEMNYEFRVTRNLGVTSLSYLISDTEAKSLEKEITDFLNGEDFNPKVSVSLIMNSYIPTLPEIIQKKEVSQAIVTESVATI
jgi:hypothetical protein